MEDMELPAGARVSQLKLDAYINSLRTEQNFVGAIAGGVIAALVGAVLWAVITVATEYQIGYMAVAVGFLVGFAIRKTGKGIDKHFGIIGAVMAFAGCVLGNYLSMLGFGAKEMGMDIFSVISILPTNLILEAMMEGFSPIDLLFYGIAIYQGYNFSFRKITEEEIREHALEYDKKQEAAKVPA